MINPRQLVVLVLGGGRGRRLLPLTRFRAKPAVPLAGKYRLIDIPLSNCIHSGYNQIYVLTQFLSVSLHRHIRQTYRFDAFSGGFVELLAAQQTSQTDDWYQGTADAVRKNLRYLQQAQTKYVLILSGDQLYRMDYRELLATHIESQAEATIAAIGVAREAAGAFGIMAVDASGQVRGFLEKPDSDGELAMVEADPVWRRAHGLGDDRPFVASMGIYVFNRDFLVEALTKTSDVDFGAGVFPAAIRTRRVVAHLFDGYWEDIGTIDAFYEANIDLTRPDPSFDLAFPEAPIYSRARFLPPTIARGATIANSLIADGCRIGRNVQIEDSVIGLRCVIRDGTVIRRSVLMGADYYDDPLRQPPDAPELGIGPGAYIEGAIIDKNCHIGREVRIANEARIDEQVGTVCEIRQGIPVVVKGAVLPDGWTVGSDNGYLLGAD